MTNEEAKFILRAYRPNGRDAGDPAFADALTQAERDPELRGWFERQRAFDAAVAAKFSQLATPTGLAESILNGARISAAKPSKVWFRDLRWLAAAVAVALVTTLGLTLRSAKNLPELDVIGAAAVQDLDAAHDHHDGFPAGLSEVQSRLANSAAPLPRTIALDLDTLRKARCRAITVQGCQLFEICFSRDGAWFHLYVAPRSDVSGHRLATTGTITLQGSFASTSWVDNQNVYILVTDAGADALKRLI
jgi:hypothetical protein